MSVGKIKKGFTDFGSNVVDTVSTVTDKVVHVAVQREYDKDDELISHYEHDLKKAKSGLNYIVSSNKKLAKTHWPRLFTINIHIVQSFISIIGADSLSFKGIEEYYNDFDKFQAASEVPMVHPKEKQFLIDSVNQELYNYLSSLEEVKSKVSRDWDLHQESLKLRVSEMVKYLNDTLKLIKKRNKKKNEYEKTERKITKLMKRTTPLDDKEQASLSKHEADLKVQEKEYNKLNEKLKSILPHVIQFLDEFVESITQLLLCQQVQTYKDINRSLDYFCNFHGFLEKEDGDDAIQSYEHIMSQWEEITTPTRLQIESFISIIYDKNPELIDTEIDEKDKTSQAAKMWNKLTDKVVEKKHTVKSKDHVNGVFSDVMASDPLASFIQYQDPNSNISDTYHPNKVVDIDDILVQPPILKGKSPELPPRTNTAHTNKALPLVEANKVTTPLPPIPRNRYQTLEMSSRNDSMESIHSDSDSIISDTSTHSVSSISSDIVLHHSTPEAVNKNLKKIYNSSKNNIKYAPIPEPLTNHDIHPTDTITFDKTTTVTYKLHQFNKFFEKILALSESMQVDRKVLEAKYDFPGLEPGDLSFHKGDQIEIIFDFQSIDTLYSNDQKNWIIGATKTSSENFRIGFVPSNYF
ncbi:uncharacterized protein RJT20DRAFT_58553 [Scheffersomyces xylosifermentans]|uniref:uncharacterized protein n=1 Tax=Scheffersomyces xylosifermentans TaxID=1304137 RepID=UPI00315D1889